MIMTDIGVWQITIMTSVMPQRAAAMHIYVSSHSNKRTLPMSRSQTSSDNYAHANHAIYRPPCWLGHAERPANRGCKRNSDAGPAVQLAALNTPGCTIADSLEVLDDAAIHCSCVLVACILHVHMYACTACRCAPYAWLAVSSRAGRPANKSLLQFATQLSRLRCGQSCGNPSTQLVPDHSLSFR